MISVDPCSSRSKSRDVDVLGCQHGRRTIIKQRRHEFHRPPASPLVLQPPDLRADLRWFSPPAKFSQLVAYGAEQLTTASPKLPQLHAIWTGLDDYGPLPTKMGA
jgi:hypothetical protein